jgi:hypothetical protein
MKKSFLILLLSFSLFASNAYAQAEGSSYQTAIGVKFYPGAITFKHFIRDNRAIEGLGYFYNYGFRLTGLYEIHGDINDVPGLKWYVGPGAHIGFWNEAWSRRFVDRSSGLALGIDGVLGLDYKIEGAPINISVDWQPSFNIISYTVFEAGWGGIGIRYTLK